MLIAIFCILAALPARAQSPQSEWPYSASQRQFYLNGDSGIYRLRVPACAVTEGQPAILEVELLPFPQWPNDWFMVKERTDTHS